MNNRPQGVTTAWYFVAVTFDAGSGRVETAPGSAQHVHIRSDARRHRARRRTIKSIATNDVAAADCGAAWESARQGRRVTSTARSRTRASTGRRSSRQEIAAVKQGRGPADRHRRLGFFRRTSSRTSITDTSGPRQAARPDGESADARRDGSQLGLVRDGLQARPAAVRRHLLPRRRHRRRAMGGRASSSGCRTR